MKGTARQRVVATKKVIAELRNEANNRVHSLGESLIGPNLFSGCTLILAWYSSVSCVSDIPGTVIDGFSDNILGYGKGTLRIRPHDAICDVI